MLNEFLLILSLIFIFGAALVAYRFFGKAGLYAVSAVATVTANIEVLILVDAFGLEQTLGNVLFAVTFLITDILSENEGKKPAQTAVNLGILCSVFFLVISQSWLLYQPSAQDWVSPAIHTIFTNTPRMLFASLIVYAVSQKFDIWLYHKWWDFTAKRFDDRKRFLWLRNNGSTMVSQLVNTVLFNIAAFVGTYNLPTLISIIAGGYIVYFFTSLLDTPFVYWARKIKAKRLELGLDTPNNV